MIQLSQILMSLMIGWSPMPVLVEINSAMLIGKWCLASQTINGKDLEKLSVKTLNDKLKAKPWQSYHFQDGERVEVAFADKSSQTYLGLGRTVRKISNVCL